MWSKLRNKQVNGLKFFRQYGIGWYIADFYCPKIRLAVEVDGGRHYMDEGKAYDAIREQVFGSLELTPLTPL